MDQFEHWKHRREIFDMFSDRAKNMFEYRITDIYFDDTFYQLLKNMIMFERVGIENIENQQPTNKNNKPKNSNAENFVCNSYFID